MIAWLKRWSTRAAPVLVALVLGWWFGAWLSAPPEADDRDDAPRAAADPHQGHDHGASGHARGASSGEDDEAGDDGEDDAEDVTWTCAMHPQVQVAEPGQCPICGMDLIPVARGGGDGPPRVKLSEAARRRAGIRTVTAERRPLERRVALTGEVVLDESRVARASAWFSGRIESMFVDRVGAIVDKGDRLFTIYSPDLLVAQREYLQAKRQAERGVGGPLGASARRALEAAEERLRLWGMSRWQIDRVAKTGEPSRAVTVYAPIGGTVIARARLAGGYVDEGTEIYTIADLSRVWVELRAYERDLPWLAEGARAEFQTDTHPGERFAGEVSYIAPTIDRATRTAVVRVEVDNPGGTLKPGAWVRGFVDATWSGDPPLLVPESAPLVVGDRAVIFVAVEGADEPTYLAREVRLGPRAGGMRVVLDGLMAGEEVVADGAFKLDSVLQIRGDRSLMSASDEAQEAADPEDGTQAPRSPAGRLAAAVERVDPAALTERVRAALGPAVAHAVAVSEALAADDLAETLTRAAAARASWRALADALAPRASGVELSAAAEALAGADDLRAARRALLAVHEILVPHAAAAGEAVGEAFQVTYCPMAFDDDGAFWLQAVGDVRNPYYGAEMLSCGVAVEGGGPR